MEKKIKYLIVGGGVAGTTAAETIRQKDDAGTVAIVSDEPYRFYSRIMLSKPNFFLEKIPFEQVWLKDEAWYGKNRVELLAGRKAIKLDSAGKTITLDNGDILNYEKLLLSIGGCARPWPIAGAEKRGIFYLRTLDDAKGVISMVKTSKQAISVGGGFISFEMCDMLRLAGIDVTLLLRESYFWEPMLDETSGRMIEDALEKGGVKIMRNTEVSEIIGENAVEAVITKKGEKIPCQIASVGIGVFCPFTWVAEAGVKVNRGILSDEYLETSVPDIFVAGDSAEFKDLVLGEQIQLGNWVNAQMQGRTAGLNMTGAKNLFSMVSFYTTQGFGITIGFVGDVRPEKDRLIISRGSKEMNSYARLLLKDGKLMGATLINRTQELGPLSKLIEKRTNLAGKESELADVSFSLANLLK